MRFYEILMDSVIMEASALKGDVVFFGDPKGSGNSPNYNQLLSSGLSAGKYEYLGSEDSEEHITPEDMLTGIINYLKKSGQSNAIFLNDVTISIAGGKCSEISSGKTQYLLHGDQAPLTNKPSPTSLTYLNYRLNNFKIDFDIEYQGDEFKNKSRVCSKKYFRVHTFRGVSDTSKIIKLFVFVGNTRTDNQKNKIDVTNIEFLHLEKEHHNTIKTAFKLNPQNMNLEEQELTKEQLLQKINNYINQKSDVSTAPIKNIITSVKTKKEIEFLPPKFEKQSERNAFNAAVRDNFGEVLSPLCIVHNHPVVKDNPKLKKAIEVVFDNQSLENATIVFPKQGENLIDSWIQLENKKLEISHKGAVGANASLSSLFDKISQAMERTKDSPDASQKWKFASEIIELAVTRNKGGKISRKIVPILMAEKINLYRLEWGEIKKKIISIINNKNLNKIKIPKKSGMDQETLISYVKKHAPNESDDKIVLLIKNILSASDRNNIATPRSKNSNIANYLLSKIAYDVAAKINQNPEFSSGVREILNNSDIIQYHTNLIDHENKVEISNIEIHYPPTFEGTFKIVSGYGSSGTTAGGFTFNWRA